MTKCTITVKKDGGNIFSNSHNVTAMSASRVPIFETVRVLEQTSLKKQGKLSWVRVVGGVCLWAKLG